VPVAGLLGVSCRRSSHRSRETLEGRRSRMRSAAHSVLGRLDVVAECATETRWTHAHGAVPGVRIAAVLALGRASGAGG
jgi:hypothetical protein